MSGLTRSNNPDQKWALQEIDFCKIALRVEYNTAGESNLFSNKPKLSCLATSLKEGTLTDLGTIRSLPCGNLPALITASDWDNTVTAVVLSTQLLVLIVQIVKRYWIPLVHFKKLDMRLDGANYIVQFSHWIIGQESKCDKNLIFRGGNVYESR